MKVDVVIAWYEQEDIWPLVAYGLNDNRNEIEKVILVNDAFWEREQLEIITSIVKLYPEFPKCMFLDHPHNDFGQHKSIKQGSKYVTTEWWVHIDGDIVLAPLSIASISEDAERGILRFGVQHDIARDTPIDSMPKCTIERCDPRLTKELCDWVDARDGYVFSHIEDYMSIGGHDESYPGYGCCDYDIAVRWMMHFGENTLELCADAKSYHIDGVHVHHPTDIRNHARFKRMLAAYTAWLGAKQ